MPVILSIPDRILAFPSRTVSEGIVSGLFLRINLQNLKEPNTDRPSEHVRSTLSVSEGQANTLAPALPVQVLGMSWISSPSGA
jgi:hypothetical protein